MTTPPPATEPAATPPPATEEGAKERRHRPFGEILRESVLEGNTVTVTVLALLTATVLGGLLAAFTNTTVLHAWGNFFSAPGNAIAKAWAVAAATYVALFQGSVFNPHTVSALFQQASISTAIHDGYLSAVFNPLSETAVQATPLILAGRAAALPSRAGFSTGAGKRRSLGGASASAGLGYNNTFLFLV